MKATIAALCFLVAVAYAIKVDAMIDGKIAKNSHAKGCIEKTNIKTVSRPIDEGALNPKCVKPPDCPGNDRTVYYYNRKGGCKSIQLGANCTDNGNYEKLEDCNKYCLPPPGKQARRA
uniref:Putative tick kunitz 60 n=1 Tax=Ixodes ricinus TaxID=34613 RepID=V5GSW5_IXORI